MTKLVTITIEGDTEAAVSATARRVVNTANNVAAWVDTNQRGLIKSIRASTRDVTVAETKSAYTRGANGNLVVAP